MDGGRAARARYETMERDFKKKMDEDRRNINTNTISLAREKYQSVITDLLNCRIKNRKEPRDYRLLKRYDILEVGGRQRLIVPMKPGQEDVVFYVSDEEIFDVLHKTHIKLGHGGRDKMMKHLKVKYKNITYKDVKMYLDLCELCLPKQQNADDNNGDLKSVLSNALNSRGQIDIIDFTSKPDRCFKYVLVYEHVPTKFVVLLPLETKSAEDVADKLIDVFTTIGAPGVIQSDGGRQFSKDVVESLKNQWPELRVVHGATTDEKPPDRAYSDVESMLDSWMQVNKHTEWSRGLRFVQLMKNRTSSCGSKKSPYENLFGFPIKIGLNVCNMPHDVAETSTTEEDLRAKMDNLETDTNDQGPTSEFHYVKTEPYDLEFQQDFSDPSDGRETNVCSVCHNEGADLRKCIVCEERVHVVCGVSQRYYEEEEQEQREVVCFPCGNREVKQEKRQNAEEDEEEEQRKSKMGRFVDEDEAILPDPAALCVPVLETDRAFGGGATNSNSEWAY